MRISDWSSDVCSSDLILAHPIDRETEIEFALRHRPPAVQHLPACRRAARYRFEHLVGVEAGYLGKAQRLGHALDDAGDRDLVDHLGRLAGAGARSEEHTSELQSLMRISYAVFCLKKKTTHKSINPQSSRLTTIRQL